MSDIYDAVYGRGLAICNRPDIKTDTMAFRFKDELFQLPTTEIHPHAEWNGYFYTIPIDKLREVAAKGK